MEVSRVRTTAVWSGANTETWYVDVWRGARPYTVVIETGKALEPRVDSCTGARGRRTRESAVRRAVCAAAVAHVTKELDQPRKLLKVWD